MSKKRPVDNPVGRQVRSRQESPPVPSSRAPRNIPLSTTASTHLVPPPLTYNTTSFITQGISFVALSNSGTPTASTPAQPLSSAVPNISGTSTNPASSSSAPAKSTKHRITTGFRAALGKFDKGAKALGVISLGMGELLESLNVIENEVKSREEYKSLKSELESVCKTLDRQFSETALQMTESIENIINGIKKEIDQVREKCDRTTLRRLAEATGDGEDILSCYRRVQRLLSQLSINANLEMWKIVDIQLAENRLRGMKISEAARYNSSESTGLLRGRCTPKTRKNVISRLHTWVESPDNLNVYWLNGMAGTGKTTIAYSFCAEREEMHSLGASFFCSRSSTFCSDATMIVPTIAYQLALFSYPFRSVLCELLGKELDICNREVSTQFQKMIVDTLGKIRDSVPQNTVVVIDALDECSNQRDVEVFLKALLKHASQLRIKFFVSSRAEGATHPQMMLNPTTHSAFYLHEVEESFVREDIELYVTAELNPISPAPDQISQLVQQAGRLFIYAATVIRYVKRDGFDDYSLDRLDSLLQLSENNDDIDELYTHILTSAFSKPRLSARECTDMLEVLHTVICVGEPLTVDALGVLLRPEHPKVVRTALKPFYSVLHVSQLNHLVAVLHASFPDYLFSQQRAGRFYCNKEQHHQKLARMCVFRISAVDPPFNISGLKSAYMLDSEVPDLMERIDQAIPPELFYACRHWIPHVEMGGQPEELRPLVYEFLTRHLLLWMEVMNLKKCIVVGGQLLSRVQQWFLNLGHDNAMLDLVRDVYRFVTVFASSPASLSTPHIYISMLALWPPARPVSAHYRGFMQRLVGVRCALPSGNSLLLARWPVDYPPRNLAVSPDGIHFAIAYDAGDWTSISIWDSYTGQNESLSLSEELGFYSFAYSPDGTHIAFGTYAATVYVWETRRGQITIGPLGDHTEGVAVNSVTYSPDGTRIISGSDDGTIHVWDSSTGHIVHVLEGNDAVCSVACSPDSAAFASACRGGDFRIWDLKTSHILHSWTVHILHS